MKHLTGIAVAAVMTFAAASPAYAQQKPLAAAEVAKIKEDVIKAANDYLTSFSKEDWKSVADNTYSHPAITIGQNGVQIVDPAKQMETYANNAKNMKADGWVKSYFYNPTVCVINANVALMSSKYRRYDKDGKVILEGAETDVFGRTANGWKLVGLFGHAPNKTVTCND